MDHVGQTVPLIRGIIPSIGGKFKILWQPKLIFPPMEDVNFHDLWRRSLDKRWRRAKEQYVTKHIVISSFWVKK